MRLHTPHTNVMGKRDVGSDAPAKGFLIALYRLILGLGGIFIGSIVLKRFLRNQGAFFIFVFCRLQT